jgi:ABC-type antimicrobial peptide transport system permease subunit
MAIMVSIPAGISATQASTQQVTEALSNSIQATASTINMTMTQIQCSLASSLQGFGFGNGNFTPGDFGGGGGFQRPGNFTPGQFGGGFAPGQFGAGNDISRGSTPMNESIYSDIASLANVAAVEPILDVTEGHNTTVSTPFGSFTRVQAEYIIEGIPLTSDLIDNYPILPTNITEGQNLKAGDSGVVLLSENNSAYFGVGVGGTVTILGKDFTVVGIHGTAGIADRQILYMNLSDAQAISNNTGMITSLQVFADSISNVSTLSDSITALHSELNVVTPQERLSAIEAAQTRSQELLQNAQSTLNQTQSTAITEIVVAVAATSLIVLFVMLYTVRERTKEIGTLKAIGFSNWTVMSQFMVEGILLSLVAGVVGIGIGVIAAPFLVSLLQLTPLASSIGFRSFSGAGITSASTSATAVTITPELMLIAFGAAVALGAVGSLYPAWRAARTRPAEAMRYE